MSEERKNQKDEAGTKVSRRDFARTSVAAGAAAVALPSAVRAEALTGSKPVPKAAAAARKVTAHRVASPPEVIGYGGSGAPPNVGSLGTKRTKRYASGWQPGTTIPAEYYLAEEHYLRDEAFLKENQWMFADHVSRIPNAGDYFVFQFGHGESVIVVRNQAGEVKAFHNVCRHRGSRLCRHDADSVPSDPRLSVKQLGQDGSSPVFRCPYHARTYDTDGSLIYAYGMQDDFDAADNGLIPCHLRIAEGNIFVHLTAEAEPPDFDEQVGNDILPVLEYYGVGGLKVAARQTYPIYGNWKLALENFQECYHCGPSHKSLVTAHNWDQEMSPEQRAERGTEVAAWVKKEGLRRIRGRAGMGGGGGDQQEEYETSMGGNLNPGFMTGSMDGKAVAPLLPNINEWTYGTRIAGTRFFTFYAQCYDDHIGIARFTPRGAELTDCELLWLVHPDAVEGRDYDPDAVAALWHVTIQEDIWVVENNHEGVRSGAYRAGRYAGSEGGPSGFVQWYMNEIVGTT